MKKIFIILVFLSVSFGSQSEEIFLSCECEKTERYFYGTERESFVKNKKGEWITQDEGMLILTPSYKTEEKRGHKNPLIRNCDEVSLQNTFEINTDTGIIYHNYLHIFFNKDWTSDYKIVETTNTKIVSKSYNSKDNIINDINEIIFDRINANTVISIGPVFTGENDSSKYFINKDYFSCSIGEKLF